WGTGLDLLGRGMGEQPGGADGDSHIGEHELQPLKLGQDLTELAALAEVVDGDVESSLGDADGLGGHAGASTVERAQSKAQALTGPADQPAGRHRDVVEVDLS